MPMKKSRRRLHICNSCFR